MARKWWDKKALELQQEIRADEIIQTNQMEEMKLEKYTNTETRLATVHGRLDIVLLVSLVSSANKQLSSLLLLIRIFVTVWIAKQVYLLLFTPF